MKRLSKSHLIKSAGSHVASEAHVRVQVLAVEQQENPELFSGYHGELLLLALKGTCMVWAEGDWVALVEGDQALLIDGEAFCLEPAGDEVLVQFTWMPGPNPCETCWENIGHILGKPQSS